MNYFNINSIAQGHGCYTIVMGYTRVKEVIIVAQSFNAIVKKHEGINGAYVEIPFDVEEVFGAKRVKVKARFDGVEYRGSIVRMGGCYWIGLTQELRKTIAKNPGDSVQVEIEKDEDERVVELPPDFAQVLKKSQPARSFFEQLSYTHQKDYVQWINSAKRPATRTARIEKALSMLQAGKKSR